VGRDSSIFVDNFRTLKKKNVNKLFLLQLLENISLLEQEDQTIPFLASVLCKNLYLSHKFYASVLKTNAFGK